MLQHWRNDNSNTLLTLLAGLLSLPLLCHSAAAEHFPGSFRQLPAAPSYLDGYRPTLQFCIELDEESGRYQALSASEARFNRSWLEEDQALSGNDAQKALLKMGLRALYQSFYQRSAGAQQFLPDQDGKIKLKRSRVPSMNYRVNVSGDSLRLGMELTL